MSNSIVAVDLGWHGTKIVYGDGGRERLRFDSTVAPVGDITFSMGGGDDLVVEYEGRDWAVGESARTLSSHISTPELYSNWVTSRQFKILFHAALSKVTTHSDDLDVVTGLPVQSYKQLKVTVKDILLGTHTIVVNDVSRKITVKNVQVLEQPIGTAVSLSFDKDGKQTDYAQKRVGVVDIGGGSTDWVVVQNGSTVPDTSGGLDIGGWSIVSKTRAFINQKYPDLQFHNHEIAEAVIKGNIECYRDKVDLTTVIQPEIATISERIVSELKASWRRQNLYAVVLTGGGSLLLKDAIMDILPQQWKVETFDDPIYGNVKGWYFVMEMARKAGGR